MSDQIDLETLTAEQLEALRDQATRRIIQLEKQKRADAFSKIEEVAKTYGLTKADLADHYGSKKAARHTRKPATPKYCNPADPAETWSGRGRKPAWVAQHLDKGGKLEELTIS